MNCIPTVHSPETWLETSNLEVETLFELSEGVISVSEAASSELFHYDWINWTNAKSHSEIQVTSCPKCSGVPHVTTHACVLAFKCSFCAKAQACAVALMPLTCSIVISSQIARLECKNAVDTQVNYWGCAALSEVLWRAFYVNPKLHLTSPGMVRGPLALFQWITGGSSLLSWAIFRSRSAPKKTHTISSLPNCCLAFASYLHVGDIRAVNTFETHFFAWKVLSDSWQWSNGAL